MTETISPPTNRMTKRRLRTRQQLVDAARNIILKNGYDDASAEAIAELADVGRSTFYNHFENKMDAVIAMLTEHYHSYGDAAYIPVSEVPDRAISMAVAAIKIFQNLATDPLTQKLIDRPKILSRALTQSQESFLVEDIEQGVAQGRFKFVTSLETLANVLNWSLIGMLTSASQNNSSEQDCLEWTRFFLLTLGIKHEEIEELLSQAKKAMGIGQQN